MNFRDITLKEGEKDPTGHPKKHPEGQTSPFLLEHGLANYSSTRKALLEVGRGVGIVA